MYMTVISIPLDTRFARVLTSEASSGITFQVGLRGPLLKAPSLIALANQLGSMLPLMETSAHK